MLKPIPLPLNAWDTSLACLLLLLSVWFMLGIIVGLSVGVSPTNYQFVYSALNKVHHLDYWFPVAGGSFSYVATKKTESSKDSPEGENG